jgi:hypothetical protein
MKVRASIVILAALVALMVASGASARHMSSHSNAKQAVHALKKVDRHVHHRILSRAVRQY